MTLPEGPGGVVVVEDGPEDVGRSRGSSTMARTRGAILYGTRTAILRYGSRRTTMIDIAQVSAVAKATLYNHFRTKSDVYVALGRAEVELLLAGLGGASTPAEALEQLGLAVAHHPLVRYLVESEPVVLANLLSRPLPATEESWVRARAALLELFADSPDGPEVTELAIRWVVSQVFWPCTPTQAARAVAGIVGVAPQPSPS